MRSVQCTLLICIIRLYVVVVGQNELIIGNAYMGEGRFRKKMRNFDIDSYLTGQFITPGYREPFINPLLLFCTRQSIEIYSLHHCSTLIIFKVASDTLSFVDIMLTE